MGITKWCLFAICKWWSPLEKILEIFDEMGYLMGIKTLNGYNFWTNKDIDMGFLGLLLWRSKLLNEGEIKHLHIHHIHTNFNELLLNGAKTIENIQTYPFPQYP